MHRDRRCWGGRYSLVLIVALGVVSGVLFGSSSHPATATEDGPPDEQSLLEVGAAAYSTFCANCHRDDGSGVDGFFPPLVDNPNLSDPAYVIEVSVNGLEGEIEVNGVVYDGVMPGFPSLTQEQLDGIVAYIAGGFTLEPAPSPEPPDAPPDQPDAPDPGVTPVDDDSATLIATGAQAYTTACAGCHQAGGTGVEGLFPPLVNNPRLGDTEYLASVIRNGLRGEIEVGGIAYNGVMPGFDDLTDDQVEGMIAYMQAGFVVPGGTPGVPTGPTGPVAGTELPALANIAIGGAFLLAGAAVAVVLGPRFAGRVDRLSLPWLDAWMKTAIIVVFFIVFTVYVPSRVLQAEAVARLDRIFQDLIGSGLWLLGLGVGLWALWYAHRDRRI